MPITVTLDMNDTYTKKTLKADNAESIKSIFPNYEEYGVSENEFSFLKRIASLSGDKDILESQDLALLHMGESMKKGNLEYEKASIGKTLCYAALGDGWNYGDRVIVSGLDPKMTLGEAEKYFGLPDGALKFNYTDKKSNYKNQLCANGSVTIMADDFPGGKEYAKVFCEKSKEYKK